MRRIALQDLKDRLVEYVARVEAGETLLVTDRDHVVAELVPPRPADGAVSVEPGADQRWLSDDEAIALGRREGWLTPSTGTIGLAPQDYPRRLTLEQVMADLAKDREDR